MQKLRLLIACAVVIVGAVLPLTAGAVPPSAAQATATFEYTKNLHPLGYSAREIPLDNTVPGAGSFNSDLAFWGNTAVQGTYAGFRLINVEEPDNPDGDHQLGGVPEPVQQQRQPGRRDHLG